MNINTERLILRPFVIEDANDLYEYLKKPAFNCFAHMKLNSIEESKAEILNRQNQQDSYFAIVLKESGKVIGEISIHPETSEPTKNTSINDVFSMCWMLNVKYQGQGYGFEAIKALYDYLFDIKNARRIYAYTEDYNIACQKLCEKLGMRKEGMFMQFVSFVCNEDGSLKYENTMQYTILKHEWKVNKYQRETI